MSFNNNVIKIHYVRKRVQTYLFLTMSEPPVRFKQPLNDLEVWEQDLAILECEVPEDSVPITWYLEDRRLQPGAKYGMEEWGTKRRLTIRDMGVDDDGIYLCEMPDGGRSIAEVTVKGKYPRKYIFFELRIKTVLNL